MRGRVGEWGRGGVGEWENGRVEEGGSGRMGEWENLIDNGAMAIRKWREPETFW